jgi:hypothetical protein
MGDQNDLNRNELTPCRILASVGVRLPKAVEVQREWKMELERERESGTESKANSCNKIPPPWGCPCESIYRRGQWSHYNALNALNHLLAHRVHDQGGNPVYYIKTPLYNASNKTLTHVGGDVMAFG